MHSEPALSKAIRNPPIPQKRSIKRKRSRDSYFGDSSRTERVFFLRCFTSRKITRLHSTVHAQKMSILPNVKPATFLDKLTQALPTLSPSRDAPMLVGPTRPDSLSILRSRRLLTPRASQFRA